MLTFTTVNDVIFLFLDQVRAGGLRAGVVHPLRDGPVQPVRVEQPAPLRHRERGHGEPVQRLKLILVHHGHIPQTGILAPFFTSLLKKCHIGLIVISRVLLHAIKLSKSNMPTVIKSNTGQTWTRFFPEQLVT